jgi:hypothetical protein
MSFIAQNKLSYPSGVFSLLPEDLLSLEIGGYRPCLVNLSHRTRQHVFVDQKEVGILAYADATPFVLDKHLFGNVDIDKKLDGLVNEINLKGKGFLKQYLTCLAEQELTEEEELNLVDVAVQTIRIDNRIEYSEIKFFKVLRSNLKKVSDETLLEKIDGIDENYLAQDIRVDYLQIYDDYFNTIKLPKFELMK